MNLEDPASESQDIGERQDIRIYDELGPSNRYDVLCGKALIESYLRNDPVLEELSSRLAELLVTIPFSDDRFDIIVSPLADQIEKIIKENPYGKEMQRIRLTDDVTLSLWQTNYGAYWIRMMTGTWAKNKAVFHEKVASSEQKLDDAIQIKRCLENIFSQGKKETALLFSDRIFHEIGSTIRTYRDVSGEIKALKTFRNHDMGGIRFGYSYYFKDSGEALSVWKTFQHV